MSFLLEEFSVDCWINIRMIQNWKRDNSRYEYLVYQLLIKFNKPSVFRWKIHLWVMNPKQVVSIWGRRIHHLTIFGYKFFSSTYWYFIDSNLTILSILLLLSLRRHSVIAHSLYILRVSFLVHTSNWIMYPHFEHLCKNLICLQDAMP